MYTIQKSEVPRIAYLDGLRGIAALMVLMAHLMISLFPAVVTFLPQEVHTSFDISLGLSPIAVFWTGNFAVCIFFVLSGFVLADFCQRAHLSFPAQLARRYCRLAFPMLMTSTCAWALLHLGVYNNFAASREVTHSGWLSAWYNFDPQVLKMTREALVNAFIRAHAKYNCNLWSMHFELIGSAYVFALFALLRNRYLRLAAVLWFMRFNYEGYYLLFAWGVLLHDFQLELTGLVKRLLPLQFLRSVFILGIFLVALYFGGVPDIQPGMVAPWHAWLSKAPSVLQWHMLGAMLLVMIVLQSRLLHLILASRLGKFLGKISFVLYLIHIPLICSITPLFIFAFKGLPYWQMALVSMVGTLIAVIWVSKLLFRYVDEYAMGFSRSMGSWVDKRLLSEDSKQSIVDMEFNKAKGLI